MSTNEFRPAGRPGADPYVHAPTGQPAGAQWEGPGFKVVGEKVNPLLHPQQFKAQRAAIWNAQDRGHYAVYSGNENEIAGKKAAPLMDSAMPKEGGGMNRVPKRLMPLDQWPRVR